MTREMKGRIPLKAKLTCGAAGVKNKKKEPTRLRTGEEPVLKVEYPVL